MSVLEDPLSKLKSQLDCNIPFNPSQSSLLLQALEGYRDVAENSRAQWGDDYLWEKWELSKTADRAYANLYTASNMETSSD